MRRRNGLIWLLVLVSLPAACAEFAGRVVSVTDGDTIGVLVDKEEHKIRLHGIDAPERKQDFGARARQYASELAFGKDVRVDVQYRDRYGREVAEVFLPDGRSMNHELVRAGFAWWYEEYAPKDKTLAALQREAQQARRGLWRDPHPQAPWEFRKQQSAERSAGKTRDNTTRAVTTAEGRDTPTRYERTPSAKVGELVAITPNGAKYHALSCRHAQKGKRVLLESARREGYQACGLCRGRSTMVTKR